MLRYVNNRKVTLMNHNVFKFYTKVGVMMLIVSSVLFSCNPKKHQPVKVDLGEKYRNMVHTVFPEKAQRYNADKRFLLIVDYSLPSNTNRFFVWDTQVDNIVEKFWCAHGFGGASTASKPEFSNRLGSNCSSLGWFLVERWVGTSPTYGYPYHAVDGLDACNSNARRRQILIHPNYLVGYDEETHRRIPMDLDYRSAGCFTMSDKGFETIDGYIKSRQKRLLLIALY